MEKFLYLFWIPDGWSVFDECTCPDPHDLPDHWYKRYTFEVNSLPEMHPYLERLMAYQQQDRAAGAIPSKENYNDLFPDISEILD